MICLAILTLVDDDLVVQVDLLHRFSGLSYRKLYIYRRDHILMSAKPTATFGAIAPKVVVKRTKTLACTRLQRIKQYDYKKGTIYIGTSMVSLSFLKSLV